MAIRNDASTHFWDEVGIISPLAYALALLGFVVTAIGVVYVNLGDRTYTLAMVVPMAIAGAAVAACYILLVSYVYSDAGRRGMSRIGWTLLAIFVPNAFGIVLYFVLRRPRILSCPQCRLEVEPGFGFCPRCRCQLNPACPRCQRGVYEGDKYCTFCGWDLGSSVNSGSAPAPNQGTSNQS